MNIKLEDYTVKSPKNIYEKLQNLISSQVPNNPNQGQTSPDSQNMLHSNILFKEGIGFLTSRPKNKQLFQQTLYFSQNENQGLMKKRLKQSNSSSNLNKERNLVIKLSKLEWINKE